MQPTATVAALLLLPLLLVDALARPPATPHAEPLPLCEAPGGRCALAATWRAWLTERPDLVAERRDLLQHAVRCALPEDVEVDVPGGALRGGFGLRPEWRSAPLATDGQEVVSACLLALVNAFGEHVTVAIAGPDVPFPIPPSFRYEEATFFGNLFADAPSRGACRGSGGERGERADGADKRVCGRDGARCGIDVVGACRGDGPVGCTRWEGAAPHAHCAEARDRSGATWRHPITVFLRAL